MKPRTFSIPENILIGIDTLEQEVVTIRSNVKEMTAAGEDSWEQLKYGVEHGWSALSTAVQDAVAKYKE